MLIQALQIKPISCHYLFRYPQKISENQRFSDVFRGYRKRPVEWNGLTLNALRMSTEMLPPPYANCLGLWWFLSFWACAVGKPKNWTVLRINWLSFLWVSLRLLLLFSNKLTCVVFVYEWTIDWMTEWM